MSYLDEMGTAYSKLMTPDPTAAMVSPNIQQAIDDGFIDEKPTPVGPRIEYANRETPAEAKPYLHEYKVASGDTLSKIAKDNGTTVDALAELNGIEDVDSLAVDQELTLGSKELPAEEEEEGFTPPSFVPVVAKEEFLNTMATLEGTEVHQGAEGGDNALTHGYGLKEDKRKELGIPMGDPRDMAGEAYQHFYDKAKAKVSNLDDMDNAAKTFVTSVAWNTGTVWGSAKELAESKDFNKEALTNWVGNLKTGKKNLAGLGNRRAKEYNILAKGRGWPTIDRIDWSTKGGEYLLSDGEKISVDKDVEPTKLPTVYLKE